MSQHTIYVVLLASAVVIALAVGLDGARRRYATVSHSFTLLCAGTALWAGSDLFALLTTDPEAKKLALIPAMTGVVGSAFGLWWTAAVLSGVDRRMPGAMVAVLGLIGLSAPLALILGDPGGVMFRTLTADASERPAVFEYGPLGLLHAGWAYLLTIGAGLVLFRLAMVAPRTVRPWAWVVVSLVFLPVAVNVVVRATQASAYDATPAAAGMMLLVLYVGVVKLRLLDLDMGLLPIARDEVVDAMSEGVLVLDYRERVLDVNPAGARLIGIDGAADFAREAGHLLPGWNERAEGQSTWEFIAPASDPPQVIEARAEALRAGRGHPGTLVLLRDITRQRNAQAALERSVAQHVHASRHDPLTGLPNRVLLFSELRGALSPAGHGCALFILDLNGFKGLNDTFGHRSGDRVLRDLGARLEAALGSDAIVARLGGDEFAVMTWNPDRAQAATTAEGILAVFATPFRVADTDVTLGASVGVAVGPEDGHDADDLVHAADVAMYHAKRTAGRWAAYEPGLDARRPEQLMLRHDLRRAIDAGELVLYYQPLSSADGQVEAVEALVRWRHSSRGLLTPDLFLPVIEDTDLICHLTDAVLDKALTQVARANGSATRVSVNLSALDLRDPALPQRVMRALDEHGVSPDMLTLEITENALAGSRESVGIIEQLRARGVRFALDDFGTGIGPLSSLRELSVDEIKIDRSFVGTMTDNPRDRSLVGSLIRLGHDLGLTVVAEGVEREEERLMLGRLGCDLLQGYLIGRPLPAEGAPASTTGEADDHGGAADATPP